MRTSDFMATTCVSGLLVRRVLGCGLLLAVAGSAGCTGGFDGAMARLKREPTTDVVPGVPSPAERTAALAEIRDYAGAADPDECQRLAAQLATGYDDETDPAIRAEIVRTAAGYPTERTAAMLRKALDDADADVRVAACEVLGRRGDAEAANLLAGVLGSDVDGDVRLAAVAALGETHQKSAVAALAEALEDRDPAMQYLAVQALREITGEDLPNDVNQWRKYVRGEIPPKSRPDSVVGRFLQMF